MRESLRGYALGIFYLAHEADEKRRIVDELASFGRLLKTQPNLAEVITDTSLTPRKRQAILGELLFSKVDPLTSHLLQAVVGTESSRLVLDSIADLVAMAASEDSGELTGGFSSSGRIDGYAQALLESISDMSALAKVEEELFDFARIVESNLSVRRVLSGIGSDARQRVGLTSALVLGKMSNIAYAIAVFAASADRIRDFVEVMDSVVNRAAEIRSRRIADVRSATELSQDQIAQISAALAKAVGSEVEMRTSVDPSLVGGVVAVVGDTVFDGSVRNKLEQLRVRLGLPATANSRERN